MAPFIRSLGSRDRVAWHGAFSRLYDFRPAEASFRVLTSLIFLLKLNDMVQLNDGRLDELFQALSNTTRRRIVSLLALHPYNIAELAPEFDMSLTAVSKHVRLLERAGIVSCKLKGRSHVCRLKPRALRDAYAWLGAYEDFWASRLEAFAKVVAEDIE